MTKLNNVPFWSIADYNVFDSLVWELMKKIKFNKTRLVTMLSLLKSLVLGRGCSSDQYVARYTYGQFLFVKSADTDDCVVENLKWCMK